MRINKILALFLAQAILLGFALPAYAVEADNTEHINAQEALQTDNFTETIYIENADDLIELADLCRLDTWSVGKRVVLKADISLEETALQPIPSFAGLFDGNGHTISGFYLTDTMAPSGFFGKLQATGTIRNLTVSGTIIPTGDAQFVGGIVGENYGMIIDCTFTGNVAGSDNTGGIAGINALNGNIEYCNVSGTVIGSNMTGGVAGCNLGGITGCVNKASVNTVSVDPTIDPADINLDFLTDVSRLKSLDVSSAATDTGGIAGYSSGIIKECTNKASVGYPHIGYNVGGIAGRSCGYIASCNNTAEVYGRKDVGGIAGQMEPYIAKNLTESELAKLERQLQELDTLLDTAIEHAEGTSSVLTNRLNGIASSVSAAASAVQNIKITGTISSSVTGNVDGSTGGSITVTPIEGEIGGDVHVEDGSVSGGGIQIEDGSISGGAVHAGEGNASADIGGSVSGSVEGEGNTSIGAGLDALTEINISTNMAGLSSALYGMAGQMSMLSGELAGASGELLADAAQVKAKINEINKCGFDILMGNGDEDIIINDSSKTNIDQITLGKACDCTNSAAITGDINIGGIAGDMGVEYALDPEDDLNVNIDSSTKQKYEVKAVIQRCKNTGKVLSKRNYAGGIVGKMNLGMVTQCESYGNISSENGNYVGGIAGICGSTIRYCCAKCSLSGGKYIGGIVGSGVEKTKTGTSSTVAACYAIVTITDHEQYIGAISGAYAGTFLENYFVSEDLAGINRMSYTGCAQSLSYTQLLEHFAKTDDAAENTTTDGAMAEDTVADKPVIPASVMELPDEFRRFNLKFVVDGEVIAFDVFDYGASFSDGVFPDIPQKKGYYAYWNRETLQDLRFDTTVTAVYEPYISALTSVDVRNGDKAVFFAEGDFGETDTLTATAVAPMPDALDITNGVWNVIQKSLTDLKVSTEIVEQWQLSISGDDTKAHTIRYLPPDGDADHMDVYAMINGEWVKLETEVIGSYVTFPIGENHVTIAVVHSINTWWAWLIVAVLLLAVVVLAVREAHKHKKRKYHHIPVSREDGEAVEPAPEGEEKVRTKAVGKNRRRLTMLLAILLLLAILGISALAFLPELIADKGAYEAFAAYVEKDMLSMTLKVNAEIGTASIPVTVDIQRTSVNGERVTVISQNGRSFYCADGIVFMENGKAYRVSDSLPDYSQLLERAIELYRHVDVEAIDGTYSITMKDEDAKAILELLIPSSAQAVEDVDSVRVDLVTEGDQLTQIQLSDSGHLSDGAASTCNVDAVLYIFTETNGADIPEAVKDAMASVDYDGTDILSEDMYRLLDGWQNLNSSAFWSAAATLEADCGPVELQENLELYRWLMEDTPVYSVQENGYGLYASADGICDRNGNTVPLSGGSNMDTAKLVDILYSLCMNGSADCEGSGERYTYALTLDAEGLKSLAHVIAPETEKMNITFTSGTVCVIMEQNEICCAEIGISGSVQTALSKADASIAMVLDFTKGGGDLLPDAVKVALIGGK